MAILNPVRWNAMLDESPCELCPHAAVCKTGAVCPAFDAFVDYGGRRWRALARVPDVEGAVAVAVERPKGRPRKVAVDSRSVESKAFMLG